MEYYFNTEDIYYKLIREPKNKDFSDFEFSYIDIEPFEGYQHHIKKGSLFNKINDKFILIDEHIIFRTNIIDIFHLFSKANNVLQSLSEPHKFNGENTDEILKQIFLSTPPDCLKCLTLWNLLAQVLEK